MVAPQRAIVALTSAQQRHHLSLQRTVSAQANSKLERSLGHGPWGGVTERTRRGTPVRVTYICYSRL
eukprot:scaffold90061_cov66-Phaeocystis_antarctica.AAC.9